MRKNKTVIRRKVVRVRYKRDIMCDSNANQDSNLINIAYIAIATSAVTIIYLIGKCCYNSIKGIVKEERDLEGLSKAENVENINHRIVKRSTKRKVKPFRLERHYRHQTSLNLKR